MSQENGTRDHRPTILIVDDTKENLTVFAQLLQPDYQVRVAPSGERALRIVESVPRPDLILLDVMMPGMDGYQVISRLKSEPMTRSIPVIFVTAMDADADEEHGLSLGAVDYVTKPVRPAILLARVRAHLELKRARDWLADQNGYLETEIKRRMAENELIKDVSLLSLATLAESRDNETGNHLHRTQGYIEVLMRRLRDHPRFSGALATEHQRQRIAKAAPLHDIGKVGIPDAILLKPGKLTADEFEIMKRHAAIGADTIAEAIKKVTTHSGPLAGNDVTNGKQPLDFLETAREIAGGHHEKWDGSGYPAGLAGEAIPLSARLMAIADVFDALISKRHYKDACSLDRTVEIVREGRARHFDPDIVDAFDQCLDEFVEISNRFRDIHPNPPEVPWRTS